MSSHDFDKKAFLEEINSIPYWVKSKEDALKYASHLMYRLLQLQHVHRELNLKLLKECPDKIDDLVMMQCKLHTLYDDAYNNQSA